MSSTEQTEELIFCFLFEEQNEDSMKNLREALNSSDFSPRENRENYEVYAASGSRVSIYDDNGRVLLTQKNDSNEINSDYNINDDFSLADTTITTTQNYPWRSDRTE